VRDLNSNGIVVYAEVHYTGNYATGGALSDACTWLAEWGSWAAGNPMVWLGAQNEPHGDAAGISRMMRTMYNAARGAGSVAPFGFCLGNPGGEITGMDATQFQDCDNTFFDGHYYGWNVSSGLSWQSLCGQTSPFHNKQGQQLCLCLETGDATDGNNIDGNWTQVLQQSLNNPPGSAAWMSNWAGGQGNGDCLLVSPYDFSGLTTYGQYVRNAMHAAA